VADLTWGDVVLIGAVATVGFTLLSYAYSALMNRKNWTYQVKPKAPKKPDLQPATPPAAAPAAAAPAAETVAPAAKPKAKPSPAKNPK
jgi:hypothetical protein